jgi:predicted lipase
VLIEVARLKNLYPGYSVHTTGHSLGAALALLTQMDLIKAGYGATMINFGQPRVGDNDFAKFIPTKTSYSYRVTHWKDIVVHNPTSDFPVSFKHHATEVF